MTGVQTCALPIFIAGILNTGFLAPATVNTNYVLNLSSVGLGPSPTWGGTGLPPGLIITPNGQISGIPSTAGTFTFTIQASGNGFLATQTLSINVLNAPVFTTSSTLPGGAVATAYSTTIGATGGVAPYVFSAPFGQSPAPGLTLGADGAITGSPLQTGTYSILITVTDKAGAKASQTFSITITPTPPPIMLSAGGLVFLSSGSVPLSQSLSITNSGSAPITFALSQAGAPAGLFAISGANVTPSILTVSVSPAVFASLAAGSYTSTLTISTSAR